MLFFAISCGEMVPVKFNPDFYEFNPRGSYIINNAGDKKYMCNEPRIRSLFAAIHIDKIKELRTIIRNAKVPKTHSKGKKKLVDYLESWIEKMESP